MSTSASVSTSSGSVNYQNDGMAFGKMVESGQIGFRLAEEIKSLREELLSLKQEKRILLVSNENLEDSLVNANNTISALHAKLVELQNHINYTASELASKNSKIRTDEDDLHQLKKQLAAEKKKNRLLGVELERSLEDEVALRSYSRRLEQDLATQKEQLSGYLDENRKDNDELLKCEHFIELSLRSQLIFQKKLETVVYYCDKDVDVSSVAIFDVSPDYLESLLRDVRSERVLVGQERGSSLQRSKLDFSVLEHKQRHIDHLLNQHLKEIRTHVAKHRKVQAKSRKHIRNLLEVIRTYEELPSSDLHLDTPSTAPASAHSCKNEPGGVGRCSDAFPVAHGNFADQRHSIRPTSSYCEQQQQYRYREEKVTEQSRRHDGSGSRTDDCAEDSSRGGESERHIHSQEERQQGRVHRRQQSPSVASVGVRGVRGNDGQAPSSPPQRHRHHHFRENSPSAARHELQSPAQRSKQQQQQHGRIESPRRASRTLALLEQLQREMEKELHHA